MRRILKLDCPAKINLHLQVVGRRSDGYHELRTIFQSIGLFDHLTVELLEQPELELVVTGPQGQGLGAGADNLVHRAARLALDAWGQGQGARLELTKRIPLGSGLGGGSSDAAHTLLALQELLGTTQETDGLWNLARQLGSDVPFFLVGGTALGIGRGDEIVPLPPLPPRRLALVLPELEVSSAEVFRTLALPAEGPMSPNLLNPRPERLDWTRFTGAWNDLQSPVFQRHPELPAVERRLLEVGAEWVRLSGSGSGVFAFFLGEPPADLDGLPPGSRYQVVETVTGRSRAER